jgi:hypothetical protein
MSRPATRADLAAIALPMLGDAQANPGPAAAARLGLTHWHVMDGVLTRTPGDPRRTNQQETQ